MSFHCLLTRCTTDTELTLTNLLLPHQQQKHVTYFSFSLSLTNTSLHSTYQHKLARENIMLAAVATCADSPALTTYTPSVMFYKHILNNSTHPHLPNGLFFPEGAWLLFASSLIFLLFAFVPLSCVPSLSLLYVCCSLLCFIDALWTFRATFIL